MTEAPSLLTIPAAARAAAVPERSLYRAVDAGEVPASIRDGTKLVALDDVVAWREARKGARPAPPAPEASSTGAPAAASEAAAPALPAPAATSGNVATATGGRPSGSAPPPALPGPLWGKLFGLLIDGVPPEQIVRQEAIPPDLVELAVEKYNDLRAPAQREDALAKMQRDLAGLAAEVANVWPSLGVAADTANEAVFKIPAVRDLEERLSALEQRIVQIERHLQTGPAAW